jgi:hypothetical protein
MDLKWIFLIVGMISIFSGIVLIFGIKDVISKNSPAHTNNETP